MQQIFKIDIGHNLGHLKPNPFPGKLNLTWFNVFLRMFPLRGIKAGNIESVFQRGFFLVFRLYF